MPQVLVVDMNRVFAECRACKTAQAEVNEEREASLKRISQMLQEIKAKMPIAETSRESIELLPESERESAQQHIDRTRSELTRQFKDLQDLKERHETRFKDIQDVVIDQIQTGLAPVIERLRTERGAQAVLEKRGVLAIEPGADITAEVIARLDAALPAIAVPPAPSDDKE